jgi:lipopolysaccharide heptosyltransferase I
MMTAISMKILIVKLSAIGDVVQTLPAVEAIKKHYPASEITWVVEEAAADILQGHPALHKVLVSRRKVWIQQLKQFRTFVRGYKESRKFIGELRSVQYDLAIDFQGLLKSGVVIGLSRARRKIGFDKGRELSHFFLNERLPAYDIEKHALDRYLDVARYLGAKDPTVTCTLPIEKETAEMRGKVRAIRKEGKRLVVVNPVARWKTKLWQEKNFSDLADRLIREKQAVVVFTGSPADRDICGRIMENMRSSAYDWSGTTSLKELAALAALSDLFITTDTGPMHLAAAAGARVLALFGPTAPWRTGPYGGTHIVLRTGIDCSPCFQRECDRAQECMRGISVTEVLMKLPW